MKGISIMNVVNQQFYDRIQSIPADKLQVRNEHGYTHEECILLDTYILVRFCETKPVSTENEPINEDHIIEFTDGGYAYVEIE